MKSAAPSSSHRPSWTSEPTPGIHLSGGAQTFGTEQQAHEDLGPGLKLALLIEGSFALDLDDRAGGTVTAGTTSLFVSREDWRLGHHFAEDMRLQYLTLFLEAGLVADVLEQDLPGSGERGGIFHAMRHTPLAMASLATSILNRPFRGIAGRLHNSGKALELAALSVETIGPDRSSNQPSLANASEIQRLHQLRDFLDTHWRDAPASDVLARQFGFGHRKMTVGFQRLFGSSISEYLRELRLREAWRLLDGGLSATLTAEETGYTLPHFTVAFTRRFGVTPGSLSRQSMT
ncbi:AraC family transcriptional regulator [Altericroceibacterium endophyticum]|uniref:Helix-turn-helix domain-containing protein n=1 Tax=Altericroceibacterium endophyticum TaxID=1808508 RepID=A0A6I4T8D8_9SPHN|nr:AraC family transcriptional regulator [Altericroceibacterium endophyticum]MXO67196.1 helix-turn-helix domain-containing protein [Altericroceibacterium endophyticum]